MEGAGMESVAEYRVGKGNPFGLSWVLAVRVESWEERERPRKQSRQAMGTEGMGIERGNGAQQMY